jgi:hypothetical protein
MTRFNVKTMTVNELVERFVTIALDQDKALFNDEIAKFNKLYGQMDTVRNELKADLGISARRCCRFMLTQTFRYG